MTFVKYSVGLIGAYCAIKSASFLWKYYVRPFPALRKKYGGSWVVITGATGGIGLGIAHELGAQGINLVITARNKEGLAVTAKDLLSKYPGIEVRTISCDAEKCTDFEQIKSVIQDLPISMLINNVGVVNDLPTNVVDMSSEEIDRIISVNCAFQVKLTSFMIPYLHKFAQKSGKQARPVVVNISSLTSKMPMPMLSVYAATKAFEEHFTEGLGAELQPLGIDAICLRPGITVSALSGVSEPAFFCPSAQTMAHCCVNMIGTGYVSVAPYAPHALLDAVNSLVPRSLTWSLTRDMHEKKRQDMLLTQAHKSK